MIRKGNKLPVGLDSFRCLVLEDYTFVDKSLFIYEFINASDKVSLILRPRRFGKSMNLDMLRYFFELVPAQTPDTCNRRDLFKDLLIETQHHQLFETHFAKYPCIYLSLKDFKATSWPLMFQEIQNKISDLFNTHNYLLDTIQGITARKFQSILDCEDRYIQSSLQFLSQLLNKYHRSPCIVLIDEYDAPLECAFTNNSKDPNHEGFDFLKKAKTFFGSLFSGLLKTNDPNIYKALLVGVLRVEKSGFLSGLNNLSVYPMFDSRYGDKFGFIEDEVFAMLTYLKITVPDDIAKWYNSYSAGGRVLLYNPWSIVKFCDLKVLNSYWVQTGSSSSIKELLWLADVDFQNEVGRLVQRESIDVDIQHDIQYELLKTNPVESLWSLLYYAGYLTGSVNGVTCSVKIPNNEVLLEWKGWFSRNLLRSNSSVSSLLELLLTGDGEKFVNSFPPALQSSLSYLNVGESTSGKNAESFYHAFCMGLFIHARDRGCEVKTECPAGKGRFDFCLLPPPNSEFHAVIMEFKVLYGKETTLGAAANGSQQISDKNYRASIPQYATKLMEVGITFEGNSADAAFSKLEKYGLVWKKK